MRTQAEFNAQIKAERKRNRQLDKLTPIASSCTVLDQASETVAVNLGGCILTGPLLDVNKRLEQMGFRPVRITTNILNKQAPYWCIDINTPSYCDPGCESYHSM